ncbi:MAG TPA: hypothetical protein VFB62_18685, partial [Polyangiaceae bacterium]|nr:hypothetical protein [Polyangiaceae bacterium]
QTSYAPNQQGFMVFGMGFSSDGPGSRSEQLFVHDNSPFYGLPDVTWSGLATIDVATNSLAPIGLYTQLGSSRAELTGTGDGRLFGFFPDEVPPVVAEIDKTNVTILSVAPQASVESMNGGFAFAHWGGDFWLFYSTPTNPSGSVVAQYQPALGTTPVVKNDVPFVVVGAGVSTCAPLQPPN